MPPDHRSEGRFSYGSYTTYDAGSVVELGLWNALHGPGGGIVTLTQAGTTLTATDWLVCPGHLLSGETTAKCERGLLFNDELYFWFFLDRWRHTWKFEHESSDVLVNRDETWGHELRLYLAPDGSLQRVDSIKGLLMKRMTLDGIEAITTAPEIARCSQRIRSSS